MEKLGAEEMQSLLDGAANTMPVDDVINKAARDIQPEGVIALLGALVGVNLNAAHVAVKIFEHGCFSQADLIREDSGYNAGYLGGLLKAARSFNDPGLTARIDRLLLDCTTAGCKGVCPSNRKFLLNSFRFDLFQLKPGTARRKRVVSMTRQVQASLGRG